MFNTFIDRRRLGGDRARPRHGARARSCTGRSSDATSCGPSILLPYGIITVVSAFAFQFAVSPEHRRLPVHELDVTAAEQPRDVARGDHRHRGLEDDAVHVAAAARRPRDRAERATSRRPRSTARTPGSGCWRVILPNMKAAVLVAVLFRTLDAVRIFDTVFIQTRGAQQHGDAVPARLQPADQPAEPRARLGGLGAAVPAGRSSSPSSSSRASGPISARFEGER